MTRPRLRTYRLRLEPMNAAHLPHLVTLDSDPEVMRFLSGRASTSHEATSYWSPRAADLAADQRSLGYWVGFHQSEFVGWWDLLPGADGGPRAEIGWRLARKWWRRGLASEGAAELLRHGFDVAALEVVWAETMAVNTASRGVMRRLGMHHTRTEVRSFDQPLPGTELGEVVYEISAAQWRAEAPA